MHSVRTICITALIQLSLGAPSLPSPIISGTVMVNNVPLTFAVKCGCWNTCTLERVVKPDITCIASCDPRFTCEKFSIGAGSPTSTASPAPTEVVKREVVPKERSLSFDPTPAKMKRTIPFRGPTILVPSVPDDIVTERSSDKRGTDPDTIWPWNEPTVSRPPPPLVKKNSIGLPLGNPPPFFPKEQLQQRDEEIKTRGGRLRPLPCSKRLADQA